MNTLEGLPLYNHYKKLAATEEKKYAWKVVQEFFKMFDEDGPQETLWFMLSAAMKLESDLVDERERSNLLFFYDYTVYFFKAVHFLHADRQKRKAKAPENQHEQA